MSIINIHVPLPAMTTKTTANLLNNKIILKQGCTRRGD